MARALERCAGRLAGEPTDASAASHLQRNREVVVGCIPCRSLRFMDCTGRASARIDRMDEPVEPGELAGKQDGFCTTGVFGQPLPLGKGSAKGQNGRVRRPLHSAHRVEVHGPPQHRSRVEAKLRPASSKNRAVHMQVRCGFPLQRGTIPVAPIRQKPGELDTCPQVRFHLLFAAR